MKLGKIEKQAVTIALAQGVVSTESVSLATLQRLGRKGMLQHSSSQPPASPSGWWTHSFKPTLFLGRWAKDNGIMNQGAES